MSAAAEGAFKDPVAPIRDDDWEKLVVSIRKGQCILFLGPGASLDPQSPVDPPLTVQLARRMAQNLRKLHLGTDLASETDLTHVAQLYVRMMTRGRQAVTEETEKFFQDLRARNNALDKPLTTQLHEDLAVLPFSCCITTVPDGFALEAFKNVEGKSPIHSYYDFDVTPSRGKPATASPPKMNPHLHPLVYELFGTLPEPGSLVLTEDNLLDFLVRVAKEAPRLHNYVVHRCKDPQTSFLFVGFGFQEWYWRLLLHVLKAYRHDVLSFALEDSSFFRQPDYQRTAVFFERGRTIEFREASWMDFARELRQRAVPEESLKTHKNAPTVFISYEFNDARDARQVESTLNRKGINIWLDKQNLRGGEQWRQAIPRVLEKQADYVVVLQSPNLINKKTGYVYREIDLALSRKTEFDKNGLLFLIPVLLRGGSLPDFQGMHQIEWRNGEGAGVLARDILEDWEKRKAAQALPAAV